MTISFVGQGQAKFFWDIFKYYISAFGRVGVLSQNADTAKSGSGVQFIINVDTITLLTLRSEEVDISGLRKLMKIRAHKQSFV